MTTLPVNSSASIGVTSTEVASVSGLLVPRTVLLTNDSANIIYVSIWDVSGSAAVINKGIRLNANGGSTTVDISNFESDKNLYINAIATGAASNLCYTIIN